ncbi:MAG: tetratricopeptide repeat protein [Polyangiaceae bacterium]|nr:tetratricopeptide repeat protein [Polyangiaceae bacterium]
MSRHRVGGAPRRREPSLPPWLRSGFAPPLAVFAVAVVPFLRTLSFEHTYDDHAHVVRNTFLHEPSNVWALLSSRYLELDVPDRGRPLLLLSHFLDRAVGGGAAWVGHLQSSLWHGVAALLVWLLGRKIGLGPGAALAAAVLFGVHPVCVEAVAGISNREDVLTTVFALLALLAALAALARHPAFALAASLAYLLALASKEMALAVPLLALVLGCSSRARPPGWRRGAAGLALGFTLVTAGFGWAQLRLGTPGLLRDAGSAPLQQARAAASLAPLAALTAVSPLLPPPRSRQVHPLRVVHAPAVAGLRVVQLVVGHPTRVEYELAPLASFWAVALGGALLLLLAGAARWLAPRYPPLGLTSAFALIATLPVSLPSLLINPVADRFLYLPAVGASWTLALLFSRVLPGILRRPVADVGLPLLLLWTSSFLALSARATGRWRDDVELFSHATLTAPRSARAHQNLGAALMERGRGPEAEAALFAAVELDASLLSAHYNLGLLAERSERVSLAIDRYGEALVRPTVRGELGLRERTVERLGLLLLRTRRFRDLDALIEREREVLPDSRVLDELARRLAQTRPRSVP